MFNVPPRQIPLLLLWVLAPFLGFGQYWMQQAGGLTVDEGYDIAIDGSGNTYTTGYFSGSATFGGTTLASNGSTDIFIVKTNNQGIIQWAKKAGGSAADRGLSIEVDGSGNCYVTGFFNGTASFDGTNVTSSGQQDVFIAKYTTAGALDWVSSAGGSGADIGNGIAVDNSGNVLVTGEFRGTATFGATNITSLNNSTDVFTTKLTSAGAFTWVEQGSGNNTDRGIDVATDGSGNVYITGQFSDTITFDQTHNNTMLNVIYVVKYNSSGDEQWFRIIGGGASNITKALVTDNAGNTVVVGDFTGNVTVFTGSNPTITGTYTNRIFLARFSTAGAVSWTQSASSESAVAVECVNLDGSGAVYIGGTFECRFDEYADPFGDGIFNSVGYKDIFVSKYNSGGNFQYSRSMGSSEDDFCFGVAANAAGNAHFTGSFRGAFNVPTTPNFVDLANWPNVDCGTNASHCGDANYGSFRNLDAAGNLDIVIANAIDPTREPYDYYERSGTGCVRDIGTPCIDPGCPDTASACSGVMVTAIPRICPGIGPDLTYQWSNSATQVSTTFTSSGEAWVIRRSADGCFEAADSIYINILPNPDPPRLSDDVIVNTDALPFDIENIELCLPDSVLLTASDFGNDDILWNGPGVSGLTTPSVMVYDDGFYTVTRFDDDSCSNTNGVQIDFYDPLPPFDPRLTNMDTTVQICMGEQFQFWLYDTIGNPSGQFECINQDNDYSLQEVEWSFSPSYPFAIIESCETGLFLNVDDSSAAGTYDVTATLIRAIPCDTDTIVITGTFTIEVLPVPTLNQLSLLIVGSPYYCPGGTTELIATGGPSYTWAGTGVNGQTNDTVEVNNEGIYSVTSFLTDTNSFGCVTSGNFEDTICVREKPQPTVTASSEILCPNDSVLLTATHPMGPDPCFKSFNPTQGFIWEGPSGVLTSTTNQVYVSEPGQYFATLIDGDSCDLISNTVTINQYTTPSLLVNGDPVICDGDSLVLSVVTNDNSVIEWQPPLSGNETEKTIFGPGTYVCKITSCDIETFAEITVVPSGVESEITIGGLLCIDSTITLYGSEGMASYSWWPTAETSDSIIVGDSGAFVLTTTDSNGCSKTSDTAYVPIDQEVTTISINGYPVFCEGDTKLLMGNSSMDTYLWLPNGETTQNIVVDSAGTYTLNTLDSNGCRGVSQPIELSIPPTFAPITIVGPTSFCEGEFVTLISDRTAGLASYTWTPTLDSLRSITIFDSGTYVLTTVDTFGCPAISDAVQVSVQPNIVLTPEISDTTICAGESVELTATTNVGDIQWYLPNDTVLLATGETFETPILTKNTSYYVWARHFVCNSAVTSVTIDVEDCESIYIPNVFTPNGDGQNDIWKTNLEEATCFSCSIYNRWGTLIHTYEFQDMGWDGTVAVSGEQASDGVYFYLVEYCRANEEEIIEHRGVVHLIRD